MSFDPIRALAKRLPSWRALALLIIAAFAVSAAQAQRVEPVNLRALLARDAAETLSAYHLFTDARARTPNGAVTPYAINTQLFSDGALKFRYVFTPPGQAAHYNAEGVFEFPVGSVLVKTFAYAPDMRRPDENVRYLETRLLIRQAEGWVARVYVWNAEQTEARMAYVGARVPSHWIDADGSDVTLDWAVPNLNQCGGCHMRAGAITPIGPKARNLNRGDQLAQWVRAGHLDQAPADAPRTPDAFDPASGSLEARARGYLDVNCAHCHNPDGPAHTSGLDLSMNQHEAVRWGLFKRPVAAGRGAATFEFAIDPGHADRSILPYRMESLDPGVMMPELGRQRVDARGLALIRDWINAMDQEGHTP